MANQQSRILNSSFAGWVKKHFKGSLPYEAAFWAYYGTKRVISRSYQFSIYRLLFPYIYKKYSRQPLKTNKVIFIEVRSATLTDDFRLLYDRLRDDYKVNLHVHYLEDYKSSKTQFILRSVSLLKDMADAKYVFISDATRVINCFDLRKGTIVMQVWHACGAFKKFGFATADKLFGDDRRHQEKYPYHKNYTYAAVSSKEVVWAYEQAFGCKRHGIVQPTGISRTDMFYDKAFTDSARSRVEEFFPEAKDRKIILYAPTFRGRVAQAEAPDKLDVAQMYEKLSDEYVLLIKHHPFVQQLPKIPAKYASFAKDCSGKLDIEDCLCAADVCITDYSSIIFEYSLFERPMLFFAYDLDDYNDWRGFFYPYDQMTPGPVCKTTEELVSYLADIDKSFDRQEVHEFRERFMGACDGHATERILKLVLGKNEKRLRK